MLLYLPPLMAAAAWGGPRLLAARLGPERSAWGRAAWALAPAVGALAYGAGAASGAEAVTLAWLWAAAAVDARHRVVPNRWVVAGGLAAVIALALEPAASLAFTAHAACALGAAGALLALRALGRVCFGEPGLGMGDVKLGLVLGLGLGPAAFGVLWGGMALAGLYGIAGRATGRLAPRARLPLVPFLFAAAAALVAARAAGLLRGGLLQGPLAP